MAETVSAANPVMDVEGLKLHSDDWLSHRMGRPAFRLEVGALSSSEGAPPRGSFIYGRVSSDSLPLISGLCSRGMQVIEVTLNFRADPMLVVPLLSRSLDVEVRPSNFRDVSQVRQIAERSFTATRFHVDWRTREVADRIKATWAENLCSGKRGSACWVAEIGGDVVGFLGIEESAAGQHEDVVSLIAVEPGYQGRSIGGALIRSMCESSIAAGRHVSTGTQLSNLRAIRFYEKCGFGLSGGSVVLHGFT